MKKFRIENLDGRKEMQFFKISEAANILGISIQTLRMYEREGLILPFRKGSNHRRFAMSDIERIRNIRLMINIDKISIAGIKRLFALAPCWKIKNCSEELKQHCKAFHKYDEPCWMVTPKKVKCSKTDCRLCSVYRDLSDCKMLKKLIADFTEPRHDQPVEPLEPIIHMPEVEIVPVG